MIHQHVYDHCVIHHGYSPVTMTFHTWMNGKHVNMVCTTWEEPNVDMIAIFGKGCMLAHETY